MILLTEQDERLLVGLGLAADRRHLERVTRAVLDRDDAVTELLRAAGESGEEGRAALDEIKRVLERHDATSGGLNLLDVIVEIGQQEREGRGEPRTYRWPRPSGAPVD